MSVSANQSPNPPSPATALREVLSPETLTAGPAPVTGPLFVRSVLLESLKLPDPDLRLVHGFSTRVGGVSLPPYDSLNLGEGVGDRPEAVRENHQRLAHALALPDAHFVMVRQVHGSEVMSLTGPVQTGDFPLTAGGYVLGDADALITDQPETLVGIRTADCVPILMAGLSSSGKLVVAAVHAGWRGTVLRIGARTLSIMQAEFGVELETVRAAIGPCIGGDVYPVGQEVVEGLQRALETAPGGTAGVILPVSPEYSQAVARVALAEANRRILQSAGLSADAVEKLERCVLTEASLFFSHRRDLGRTGRMLNFIGFSQKGRADG